MKATEIKLSPNEVDIARWVEDCPCFRELPDAKSLAYERDCTEAEAASYIDGAEHMGESKGVLTMPHHKEIIEWVVMELERYEDSFLGDDERAVKVDCLYNSMREKGHRKGYELIKLCERKANEIFRIEKRAVRGLIRKIKAVAT